LEDGDNSPMTSSKGFGSAEPYRPPPQRHNLPRTHHPLPTPRRPSSLSNPLYRPSLSLFSPPAPENNTTHRRPNPPALQPLRLHLKIYRQHNQHHHSHRRPRRLHTPLLVPPNHERPAHQENHPTRCPRRVPIHFVSTASVARIVGHSSFPKMAVAGFTPQGD
jgi:hypothetical protein